MNYLKLACLIAERDFTKISGEAIRSPRLRQVAKSFVGNMERVGGLAHMPAILLLYGRTHQAAVEVLKDDRAANGDDRPVNESDVFNEIADTLGEDIKKWSAVGEWTNAVASHIPKIEALGTHPQSADTINGWLSTLLVGTWTAFECLATDLWVSAVNARPKTLGMRALEADEFTKQSDAERLREAKTVGKQRKKRKRGSITYSILKKYDFNLSDKLGTVVHRSRKFDFNRLDGIQYAYSVVFGESGRGVLKSHFVELSLLEAARNLLVHRGGEVDHRFRERVQKSNVFGRLEDGDPFLLDGEIVQRFANTVFACGVDLLTKIDAVVAAEGDSDDK